MFHVKHFCVSGILNYAILQNDPMDQEISVGKQRVDRYQFRLVSVAWSGSFADFGGLRAVRDQILLA